MKQKTEEKKEEKKLAASKRAVRKDPKAEVVIPAMKAAPKKVIKINHDDHFDNVNVATKFLIKNKEVKNECLASDIVWKNDTEENDYPAAEDFLDLLFSKKRSHKIVEKLRKANVTHKKAKDILRASRLELLPRDNVHVLSNIEKVNNGHKLSPLLLVRGKNDLIIADGYHRVCSIYYLSEDYNIPCKLV